MPGITFASARQTHRPAHVRTDPAILYFGTRVVLVSTLNPDGSANLAPISSVFWLGHSATIGISQRSRSGTSLAVTGEAVLALPSVDQVGAVNRLALTTGVEDVPEHRAAMGYVHVADKYAHAGLTPVPSDTVLPPRPAECPIAMECVVREASTCSPERGPRRPTGPRPPAGPCPREARPRRPRPVAAACDELSAPLRPRRPRPRPRLATVDEEHCR